MDDYSVSQWNAMVKLAEDIMRRPESYADKCCGKIMATLFYEPSTRTQMSFQTAMIRLGGSIIGFDNPGNSSVSKGENLKDTIKIVSNYADVLVMRHNQEGAARAAALSADCPVINAGDGGHLHPTQTLTDLLTLKTELGRLDNLTVGLCGDLKYGRTVHSILKALSCYKNNKFILISTPSLALPQYIKDVLHARGCEFKEAATIEGAGFFKRFVKIVFPLSKGGFISGFMLIFVSIMKELDLIILIMTPKTSTLPYLAFQYQNQNCPQASNCVAIVMFSIVFLVYALANIFGDADLAKSMAG